MARIGDADVAAHQVAYNIWSLLALALDAVAIAAQAITGRQLGAGDAAGVRAATRRLVQWGLAAGLVFGLVIVGAGWALPPLFTADPAVRHLIAAVLVVVGLLQPVAGVVFVLGGVLIGAGDGRYLAWAGLLTLLAFLPAALAVLALRAGLVGLWAAIGAWMVARLVALTVRARGDRWVVTGAVRR